MNNDWDLGAVVRKWFNSKTKTSLAGVVDPNQGDSSSNLQNQPSQCHNPCFENHIRPSVQEHDSTDISTLNFHNNQSLSQDVQNTSIEVPFMQDWRIVHKRKNRERITQELETVSLMDGWVWKKYGQRVVKGSVYPRDYYKCNGHACSAKRHVDTISVNPAKYVVAYYGYHNHPSPRKP